MLIPWTLAGALFLSIFYNGPGRHFIVLPLLVSLLAFMLLSSWRNCIKQQQISFEISIVTVFLFLWVIWLFASTFWSKFPQLSWYYALTLTSFPITALIWINQSSKNSAWHLLRRLILYFGIFVSLWAIIQYILTGQRASGPLIDPNAYSAVIYSVIFLLLPQIFHNESKPPRNFSTRVFAFSSFSILSLALFSTYSRSGIGTAIILSIAFITFSRRRYHRSTRTAFILFSIAIISYAVIKIYPQHMITRTLDLATSPSLHARLLLWHSMWEIYQRHPWLGTGIATFKLFYPEFRNPMEAGSAGNLGHNDYLQFLQEQGPIGLMLLCFAGIIAFWVAVRLFSKGHDRNVTDGEDVIGDSFGLSLGLLGFFIHASVNFIFYVQPLSLLAGIFLGQAYRTALKRSFTTLSIPRINTWVATSGMACILGLPIVGLFLDGIAITVIQNQANLPIIRRISRNPGRLYHLASILEPLRPDNVDVLGVLASHELSVAIDAANSPVERAFAAQEAERDYIAVMRATDDRDASALTAFARLADAFPGLQSDHPFGWKFTPDTLLKHAIRYDPMYFPAYRLLAQRYAKAGHPQRALDLITHKAFRWYGVAVVGAQPQRIKLTTLAINLSEQLGQHARARALARNVLQNDPANQVAREALESPSKSSDTSHKQRLQQ